MHHLNADIGKTSLVFEFANILRLVMRIILIGDRIAFAYVAIECIQSEMSSFPFIRTVPFTLYSI